MDSVLRATIIYGFLFAALRLSGKRTLSEITTFDFVLLLIISEAVQNGMVDNDHSLTNAFLIVITLVVLDVGLSLLKQRSGKVERFLDGMPLVIVQNGQPHAERMKATRVSEADVLQAARMLHGLERMDQVKHAVLEQNGEISIIPRREGREEIDRSAARRHDVEPRPA